MFSCSDDDRSKTTNPRFHTTKCCTFVYKSNCSINQFITCSYNQYDCLLPQTACCDDARLYVREDAYGPHIQSGVGYAHPGFSDLLSSADTMYFEWHGLSGGQGGGWQVKSSLKAAQYITVEWVKLAVSMSKLSSS